MPRIELRDANTSVRQVQQDASACETVARTSERSDMAVAIRQDVYIGGEWLPGDGEEIEVRSPATDELLGTVTASSPTQVEAAVRAAAEAFPAWRKVSLLERVELCRAAFTICMERADEIAEMITKEVGKTIRESREEMVEYTADHFRRASEDVLRHAGSVLPSTQER